MKVLYFPNVQASLKLRSRKELTEMLITLVVTNASIYFFYRINRFRSFGLDKWWLLLADLEQREKRRLDRINGVDREVTKTHSHKNI